MRRAARRRRVASALAAWALALPALHDACAAGVEDRLAPVLQEVLAPGPQRLARPMKLQSAEAASGVLRGDAYGFVDVPFERLAFALGEPQRWCEMLLLHINNKGCSTADDPAHAGLSLKVARRYDIPPDKAFTIDFTFKRVESSARGFAAQLTAERGPVGTNAYLILLEAMPATDGRSFVHISYSYGQGTMTGVAMRLYFATQGRGKVGFTEVGRLPDGQPDYIDGTRGLVERNTMRYFLALEAYLGADNQRQRAARWFELTERYPRQLRDASFEQYMAGRAF